MNGENAERTSFISGKKIISKTKMRIYLNFKTNVAFLSASDVLESPTMMNWHFVAWEWV